MTSEAVYLTEMGPTMVFLSSLRPSHPGTPGKVLSLAFRTEGEALSTAVSMFTSLLPMTQK